jgi:hypothetical protein
MQQTIDMLDNDISITFSNFLSLDVNKTEGSKLQQINNGIKEMC